MPVGIKAMMVYIFCACSEELFDSLCFLDAKKDDLVVIYDNRLDF